MQGIAIDRGGNTRNRNIALRRDQDAPLRALAARDGHRNVSRLIRDAIDEYVKRRVSELPSGMTVTHTEVRDIVNV